MKILTRNILLAVMACLSLLATAQDSDEETQEWYLDEVVNREFVGHNDFDYYYQPSAADVAQQRTKGDVSYFLNSPTGLNTKKVRALIDRIMASYDDVVAVGDWHETTTIYWKEYRYEKNKFRFSVKRKELDDGTYYVSVVESSNYYKSLGGKGKKEKTQAKQNADAPDKPVKRSTRDRRAITQDDVAAVEAENLAENGDVAVEEVASVPVVSDKESRRAAREREKALQQEERLAKRRAQEEQRAQEKAQKEAEKQRRAEEKKQREEEKRLKREEQRRQQEQERQERQEREQARKQAAAPKPVESRYHYDDVALWLSEKYDFTQTAGDGVSTCTMFSTAVKDVEMAKLAIKNALKGSNARMAVPWRVNGDTGMIETGFAVDDHVLVFAIGKNDEGNINLVVSEVSNEQFEQFKQGLNVRQ